NAVAEEQRDLPRQVGVRLVNPHLYFEVALVAIAQDLREPLGVRRRRTQLRQPRVVVVRRRDDQRVPREPRRRHGQSAACRARNDSISSRWSSGDTCETSIVSPSIVSLTLRLARRATHDWIAATIGPIAARPAATSSVPISAASTPRVPAGAGPPLGAFTAST